MADNNGVKINAWSDKWLFFCLDQRVCPIERNISTGILVIDFLDSRTGMWDSWKLRQYIK